MRYIFRQMKLWTLIFPHSFSLISGLVSWWLFKLCIRSLLADCCTMAKHCPEFNLLWKSQRWPLEVDFLTWCVFSILSLNKTSLLLVMSHCVKQSQGIIRAVKLYLWGDLHGFGCSWCWFLHLLLLEVWKQLILCPDLPGNIRFQFLLISVFQVGYIKALSKL